MDVKVYVGVEQALQAVLVQLASMEAKLDTLLQQEGKIMADLTQVLASVQEESTLEDSIISLLNGIKAQLAAALAGTQISPAVQAQVDAIFTAVEANKTKVAAAVAANTPPSPPAPAP